MSGLRHAARMHTCPRPIHTLLTWPPCHSALRHVRGESHTRCASAMLMPAHGAISHTRSACIHSYFGEKCLRTLGRSPSYFGETCLRTLERSPSYLGEK